MTDPPDPAPASLSDPVPDADPATRAPASRRLEAIAEVALCSGFVTQLAIGVLVQALGVGGPSADGRLSLPLVASISLVDTAVLLALMVWLMRRRGERPAGVWLGPRPVLGEAWHGVAATPLLLLGVGTVLALLQRVAPQLHNVEQNPLEAIARGGVAQALALGVVAIVAGAIREELQRGFLLHRFRCDLGPTWLGVLLTSAIFGLGHVLQGWDAAVATGLLGALWAVMFVRRGGVVMALVSHACFNSLEIARMLAISR